MKIHPEILKGMLWVLAMFCFAMFVIFILDFQKPVREGLTQFHKVELDYCRITEKQIHSYPGGRGSYELFTTNCQEAFFPILFQSKDYGVAKSVIQIDSYISKTANSSDVTIIKKGKTYNLKLRNLDEVDHRFEDAWIVLKLSFGFIILSFLIRFLKKRQVI
ncbi:MAG: hypothetical protein KDC58_11540 [Cyclobacteriaceae bacterium]|nr:hypothetical protein [Cyclobacteriaceae bacterium]